MSDRTAWATVLLSAAVLGWPARAALSVRRLAVVRPPDRKPPAMPASSVARGGGRQLAWAVAAGLAAGLLLGGVPGVVAGLLVAVVVRRLLARQVDGRAAALASTRTAELPIACDLLAVTLSAGLPVGEALSAVGAALPEPLGAELRQVAALYRLGAEPRRAWAEAPPELAGLGRTLVRAGESGSAVGPALRSLSADTRAGARTAAEAALQRAGVWILAPLGLCVLPAFLCLGVVPLVLGIAGEVFG
jgi:pilus assembly protein TadC